MDALALMQAGFPQTMALGGAQGLTPALVDHLRAENVKELVLCLDGDEAGRQGPNSWLRAWPKKASPCGASLCRRARIP
ncbi:MAG: toprim domain-containing protein [Proteobacteria bacterium]|nr:toprim domain-containing protein [Pseudomonadota bacterium]